MEGHWVAKQCGKCECVWWSEYGKREEEGNGGAENSRVRIVVDSTHLSRKRIRQHNSTTAPQYESKHPTCAFDTGIR